MIYASIAFVVTLVLGFPIAFVLGIMGLVQIIDLGNAAYYNVVIQRMISQIDLTSLTCLPFFILAGGIMNAGGVTRRLLDFLRQLIGWFKGGLAYCTVAIAAILSAILGSPNAVASMLCGVLVPELRKDNYPEEFTGALVASSSILGPIIPPSMQFIVFCMMTGVSIKAMFVGGIIPGLLLAFLFCVCIGIAQKRLKFGKSVDKFELKKTLKAFVSAIPALLVPVVIIGGVIGGIFTATEAGAVSCFCAIIASVIYKEFDIKQFPKMLGSAAMTAGGILFMVSFGGVIAWAMTMSGLPRRLLMRSIHLLQTAMLSSRS